MNRSAILIWFVLIATLAIGSLLPDVNVYVSPWFGGLWLVVAALLARAIFGAGMRRRFSLKLLHFGLLMAIVGGFVTGLVGREGIILLEPAIAADKYLEHRNGTGKDLGATIILDSITGNRECFLTVDQKQQTLAANRPVHVGNSKLVFIEATDSGAVLAKVNTDRWGARISFSGYILILVGWILTIAQKWFPVFRISNLSTRSSKKNLLSFSTGLLSLLIAATLLVVFLSLWIQIHRIPLATGREALLFLAILTSLGSGILLLNNKVPTGIFLLVTSLLIGVPGLFGITSATSQPVSGLLDSGWLGIHVSLVMAAYSLLIIIVALAVTSLVLARGAEIQSAASLLDPALCLLCAGIFSGAAWASYSWGRYWGWDPKETWALITLMVYSVALHPSATFISANPRRMALYLIFSFLTVAATFCGVNYLNSLHAYQ